MFRVNIIWLIFTNSYCYQVLFKYQHSFILVGERQFEKVSRLLDGDNFYGENGHT